MSTKRSVLWHRLDYALSQAQGAIGSLGTADDADTNLMWSTLEDMRHLARKRGRKDRDR